MPVVAKGEQYVFAMNLEEVAEFVGLQGTGHTPLPPEVLIEKWILVLRAAQRLSRQLSPAQLAENVIPNRERSIRLLAHHVFIRMRVLRNQRRGRHHHAGGAEAALQAVALAKGFLHWVQRTIF